MRQWRLTGLLGIVLLSGTGSNAQPSTARVIRVSGGVMAGLLLTRVAPVYPPDARAAHQGETISLEAVIGPDGTVKSLQPTGGAPNFRQAALDAVAQWTYKPYLVDGIPAEVHTIINVRFTLADATAEPRSARLVTETGQPLPADTVRISGSVMAAQLLTRVTPTYPPDAKAKGIAGAVVLDAVIGKDGTVQKLTVVSGPEDLRDNALEAVRQWVYKPYLLNGKPVTVQTVVTVNFTLGG